MLPLAACVPERSYQTRQHGPSCVSCRDLLAWAPALEGERVKLEDL
eukprot:jgi/Botrbrau1/1217/Bobra.0163s0025.1